MRIVEGPVTDEDLEKIAGDQHEVRDEEKDARVVLARVIALNRLMQAWFSRHGFSHKGFEFPKGTTLEVFGTAWILWGTETSARPTDIQFVRMNPPAIRFIRGG